MLTLPNRWVHLRIIYLPPKVRGMLYYKRAITLKYYYMCILYTRLFTRNLPVNHHILHMYIAQCTYLKCPVLPIYPALPKRSLREQNSVFSVCNNSNYFHKIKLWPWPSCRAMFSIQDILQNVWHFIASVNMCEYKSLVALLSLLSPLLSLSLSWTLSPVETRFSERSCMHSKWQMCMCTVHFQ